MTAKPETAAEVLAEMRNRVARFEAMSMPIPAEELTSALDRLERALSAQGEVVVTRAEDGEIVMVSRQDCDGNTIGIIASTTHAGGKAQGEAVAEVYERFECKRDSLGEAYRESAGPALRFVGEGFPIGTKLYTHPAPARVTEEMCDALLFSQAEDETGEPMAMLIDFLKMGSEEMLPKARNIARAALTAALEAYLPRGCEHSDEFNSAVSKALEADHG